VAVVDRFVFSLQLAPWSLMTSCPSYVPLAVLGKAV
jgi:hypothetical protein